MSVISAICEIDHRCCWRQVACVVSACVLLSAWSWWVIFLLASVNASVGVRRRVRCGYCKQKGGQGPPFEVNGLRVVQKDQNPNLVRISVLMLLVLWLLQRWLLE